MDAAQQRAARREALNKAAAAFGADGAQLTDRDVRSAEVIFHAAMVREQQRHAQAALSRRPIVNAAQVSGVAARY